MYQLTQEDINVLNYLGSEIKKPMVNKKAVIKAYKKQGKKKNISALSREFKCSRAYIYKVIKTI